MNKKIYLAPTVCKIDFVEEGMIAGSMKVYKENIGEQFTQKKNSEIWGSGDAWE